MLVLIGYRGTGKSTVAHELAQRLGWPAVDLDDEIERAAGKSIADIFADDGEEPFRDFESAALACSLERRPLVLATGGGVVGRAANRQLLRAAASAGGRVVWLRATPQTIAQRLAADMATQSRRPNLTSAGGLGEIVSLLARRTPWYQECADLVVDTECKLPAAVAAEIVGSLPQHFREVGAA